VNTEAGFVKQYCLTAAKAKVGGTNCEKQARIGYRDAEARILMAPLVNNPKKMKEFYATAGELRDSFRELEELGDALTTTTSDQP
jgi:hypothetical protein